MSALRLFVITALLVSVIGGCASTHRVYSITEEDGAKVLREKDGIPYALPYTVLVVSVDVTRTEYEMPLFAKAEYKEFEPEKAAARLGITFREKASEPEFSLSTPVISALIEQDPNQQYLVEFKRMPTQSTQLTMALNKYGCITAGTSAVQDRTMEFAVNVAKGALQLATTATALGGEPGDRKQNLVEACESQILSVRAQRLKLLGQVQNDVPTVELALKKLQEIEDGLAACFAGAPKGNKGTVVFEIRRDCCPDKPVDIFTFSKKKGLKPGADKDVTLGAPLPPFCSHAPKSAHEAGNSPSNADEVAYVLSACKHPAKQTATLLNEAYVTKKFTSDDKRSFRYRIPLQTCVEVSAKSTVLAHSVMQVAQWGAVASMPVATLAKDMKYDIKWDENTGAITSAAVESVAENPEHINTLAGGVNSLMQAHDEKAHLQRQYDIMELKKKIRDMKKAELEAVLNPSSQAKEESDAAEE